MTPEQRAELVELLKQADPMTLRVIKYTANGGHKCTDSTSLTECCGVTRCQACHIPHLRAKHTIEEWHAYEKFVHSGALTWQVHAYKMPLVPKKETKVNKKSAPSQTYDRNLANKIADSDLEKMIALLEAKLGKR